MRKSSTIAIALIVVAVVLAVLSVWNESLIVDEIPHIGAGYSYLTKRDMRLNPEHPPLAKDLAAIPLLFFDLKQDAFATRYWTTDINGQWDFGRNLIFQSSNDAELITHAAKLPMLAFYILSAWIVFVWARRRWNSGAALIALILFLFSPTVMAHARFVTTDIAATFGVLTATYTFIKYLKNSTTKNLILAGCAVGIALLTKFSVVLLLPVLLIVACVWGYSEAGIVDRFWSAFKYGARSIIIFIVGFIVIVWPVYFFHTYNYPPSKQSEDASKILESNNMRPFKDIVIWASDKPVLRAAAQYGLGFLMVQQRTAGGNTAYFVGETRATAWKSYFPIVYFIKEPLAWWILVVVTLVSAVLTLFLAHSRRPSVAAPRYGASARPSDTVPAFGSITRSKQISTAFFREHIDEFAMLLWIVVYWFVSISGNLNIGVRHLLPVYPFTIMLVAGQAVKLYSYKALKLYGSIAIAVLLGWYVLSNLRVYPYYLTYFNELAGGPSGGYRYVVDSNLDWGQDLKRLSDWVEERGILKIEVDYFGWADPAYYFGDRVLWMNADKYKNADDFRLHNQSEGWLAVSVSFLQVATGRTSDPWGGKYLWLKAFTPVASIGNSIFIYRIK